MYCRGTKICQLYHFSQKIYYIYTKHRRTAMPKIATKEQTKPKARAKQKRLSKAALWWQKHPEGLPLIIHDIRAVMR
jgi:hypothetical protein